MHNWKQSFCKYDFQKQSLWNRNKKSVGQKVLRQVTTLAKPWYRIYSINHPGRLLNFWTLRVDAYSRWALIQGWALIKFSPFSASEVCLFCNKTINANNKTRRSNKARFLYNTLKKTPSSGKCLIRIYSPKWVGWGWTLSWVWLGGGAGGRLFEVGRLLAFPAFWMGAYSRWALNNLSTTASFFSDWWKIPEWSCMIFDLFGALMI